MHNTNRYTARCDPSLTCSPTPLHLRKTVHPTPQLQHPLTNTFYNLDPQTSLDFTDLTPGTDIAAVEPGHECYPFPNAPNGITAGSNATIQLKYASTFDNDPTNQTFYACADVTYVAIADFHEQTQCFNVSVPGGAATAHPTFGATATVTAGSGASQTGAPVASVGGSNGKLSGGTIAGIVIGSLVGAALLFGAGFVLWNRRRRIAKRNKAVELRMKDWTNPAKRTTSEEQSQNGP